MDLKALRLLCAVQGQLSNWEMIKQSLLLSLRTKISYAIVFCNRGKERHTDMPEECHRMDRPKRCGCNINEKKKEFNKKKKKLF